jgi:hypothetical protein
MDATMMNDTLISMSMLADDDNSSTVTPILDRYRLDADDNSIGIKVVPNRRGMHGRGSKQIVSETIPEVNTPSPREEFRSPTGLPGTVSARKKKYRKTPFPKRKQRDDDSIQTWDENDDPNIKAEIASTKPRSTLGSISVPPLRPRSLELRRTTRETTPAMSRQFSLPGKSSRTTFMTPLSDALVAEHIDSSHSETEMVKTSERQSTMADQNVTSESVRMGKWMEQITMAEYDRAPRVVKMQVQRDEANDSLNAIEDFLTSNLQQNQISLEFTEKQGHEVLGDQTGTEQKTKSVLMSLCHWRRLLMFRDSVHGMVFAVNQFEQ